jgi:T5orf172 domain
MKAGYKLFYVFSCPLGKYTGIISVKIGITGHPEIRLGVYQNSYSRDSHISCFDLVYYGPTSAVEKLEKAVKLDFNWDIERDGRGASEWISGYTVAMIEEKIDEIIKGHKFKIQKVDNRFFPLNIDNMTEFMEFYKLVSK